MMAIAISNVLFSAYWYVVLVGLPRRRRALAAASSWFTVILCVHTSLINLLFGLKFIGWLMVFAGPSYPDGDRRWNIVSPFER
jgi:hypothetical protein